MEGDKLILSLLARVRTWTEEGRKRKFVSQTRTKLSSRRMETKSNVREQPNLIIVHNRVKRLNPHGVNVPVQNYPFGAIMAP